MSREKSTGAALATDINASTLHQRASPDTEPNPRLLLHGQAARRGWQAGLGIHVVRRMRAMNALIEANNYAVHYESFDSKRRLQSVKFW